MSSDPVARPFLHRGLASVWQGYPCLSPDCLGRVYKNGYETRLSDAICLYRIITAAPTHLTGQTTPLPSTHVASGYREGKVGEHQGQGWRDRDRDKDRPTWEVHCTTARTARCPPADAADADAPAANSGAASSQQGAGSNKICSLHFPSNQDSSHDIPLYYVSLCGCLPIDSDLCLSLCFCYPHESAD